MGIQFPSFVTLRNIDLCKITDASNLNIVWRLDEVCTLDSPIRDQAGAIPVLNAPCDFDPLSVPNNRARTRLGWGEETKVIDRVDYRDFVR